MRLATTFTLVCLCGFSVHADDLPSRIVNTQNPNDVSLSPQESLARITVPDGFHVTLFAGEPDLRRPIAFDFDDRGRVWVVENYSHPVWKKDGATDRILILEDTDHDGRFDKRKVFWDKGRYLTGMAVGHGGVWIGNSPELSFIPDRDGDDVPDSEPIVMLDGFRLSTNNVLNNFHWGPDGWLYGALGVDDPSHIGKPGTPMEQRFEMSRGIWRFHPVDHTFERVADGMVNPWGADFNEFGDLITTNTVTAHLWHIVQGMYCERRVTEQDNPYVYRRIQSITDHLHWGGGAWHEARSGDGHHSVAGGGHAHCGGMIYLGDNWPDKYRGTFFTNNMHGNRVNNDRLVPNASTYVGVHGEDFLFGNDPWFRGMSIKYGPDGGVYISDWHDFGECHDSDGSHRTSGRIYKVVYGKPKAVTTDLQKLTAVELAELHLHRNEWFSRHARRILHERSIRGDDVSEAMAPLWKVFLNTKDEPNRLRALWTLAIVGAFHESELVELLKHESQHVRRWAVKFLADRQQLQVETASQLAKLALAEPSPKVRLALASALQRIGNEGRWDIATGLALHAEDDMDPYIPLMIWYGIEPLVSRDTEAALKLATQSRLSVLRNLIVRRTIDTTEPPIAKVVNAVMSQSAPVVRHDMLQGMLDALDGRETQKSPKVWPELYKQVSSAADPSLRSVAVRLATIFGDQQAINRLRKTVLDDAISDNDRREALQALLQVSNGASIEMLHSLTARSSTLQNEAIRALGIRNNESTPEVLLGNYSEFSAAEKQDAIGVLTTRLSFAESLLTAMESGRVDRKDVSAFALQQLRTFDDPKLKSRVLKLWADDTVKIQKSEELARLLKLTTPEYLSHGDAGAGRLVFQKTCVKCHRLFGEGGTIAPDLTGSGRKKADYVLSNLIDPSAQIDPAYRLTTLVTEDGRLFSGFVVRQTDSDVVFRTQDARIRLSMKDVETIRTSNISMMPEGMLRSFTDEQVRDLLVYLAGSGQVPIPPSSGGN
ncbi:MAG: putative membrane-bound dehydrogenase-like protein [Planctomycetaceae bacterium]|jgi:putative membrane-bound dehydrogenase-like protein